MPRLLAIALVAVVISSASFAKAAGDKPTSKDVVFVQGLLIRLGYSPGLVDGIYGSLTITAVHAFHDHYKLPLESHNANSQIAAAMTNLMGVFAKHIMRPGTIPRKVYYAAITGDADAALNIGHLYRDGESVATDDMLAFLWWTVADMKGNAEAAELRVALLLMSEITDHEIEYARMLAAKITSMPSRADHQFAQADYR